MARKNSVPTNEGIRMHRENGKTYIIIDDTALNNFGTAVSGKHDWSRELTLSGIGYSEKVAIDGQDKEARYYITGNKLKRVIDLPSEQKSPSIGKRVDALELMMADLIQGQRTLADRFDRFIAPALTDGKVTVDSDVKQIGQI